MKIITVSALLLVAFFMTTSAHPNSHLAWMKDIIKENRKTHCFDEYIKAVIKINVDLMQAKIQCGRDLQDGREIIKCNNQALQKASDEFLKAENLICADEIVQPKVQSNSHLAWMKYIVKENGKTHCFDEYIRAVLKINVDLLQAKVQCGHDVQDAREIIKCNNQALQKASDEFLKAESLICADEVVENIPANN